MDKNTILDLAYDVTNGDKIIIKYRKPAEVLTKRTFQNRQLEAELLKIHRKGSKPYEAALKEGKKSLIKVNEGGRDPVIKLYKISTYELVYDERDYFSQVLEEQIQNLYPTKKESEYKKVRGVLYEKAEGEDAGKQYVRFAIRADRIDTTSQYSSDKAGKSVKEYEDIEEYLKSGARRDYKCYNRQMTMTCTGKLPEVEIRQMTLEVDRILSLKVIKSHK